MTITQKLKEIKAFIAYDPDAAQPLRADYLASALDSLVDVQIELAHKVGALEHHAQCTDWLCDECKRSGFTRTQAPRL